MNAGYYHHLRAMQAMHMLHRRPYDRRRHKRAKRMLAEARAHRVWQTNMAFFGVGTALQAFGAAVRRSTEGLANFSFSLPTQAHSRRPRAVVTDEVDDYRTDIIASPADPREGKGFG